MTPGQVEDMARRAYNAVGDNFFNSLEILDLMYLGQSELCNNGLIIEKTFQTSSVIGQADYTMPFYATDIRSVEYDGKQLRKISLEQDALLTGYDSETASTGIPLAYSMWNQTLTLRPTPSDVQNIKVRAYAEPSTMVNDSELEIPINFHASLVYFVVKEMAFKDQNMPAYDRYNAIWLGYLDRARMRKAFSKSSDKPPVVKNEEILYRGPWLGRT
jgi:hypothetical protein